jgi:hypothetical protein
VISYGKSQGAAARKRVTPQKARLFLRDGIGKKRSDCGIAEDGSCDARRAERCNSAEKRFSRSARVKTIGVKVLCPGEIPALIAKFEATGTPVPLQCHPEVVRPDSHAELPR